jgi:hypothetical protein
MKLKSEEFIKQLRFERTSFFRPAWFYRPRPDKSTFNNDDDKNSLSYYQAMFDYYANTYCRFVFPFMYIPYRWLPRQMWTVEVDTVAKAMIRDADRFLHGEDEMEMQTRIGWRGLKRLYYDDFLRLSRELYER